MKKKLLFALLLPISFFSCKNNADDKLEKSLNELFHSIDVMKARYKTIDSMKVLIIKATFAAGYKRGCSTGINNCNASIDFLNKIATADSLNYAILVDNTLNK